MATDYDAPRRRMDDDIETDSLEGLKAAEVAGSSMDDDGEIVEPVEPPTQDLSGEELNVEVKPRQDDEFTCASCFLVRHRSQIAREEGNLKFCVECES